MGYMCLWLEFTEFQIAESTVGSVAVGMLVRVSRVEVR